MTRFGSLPEEFGVSKPYSFTSLTRAATPRTALALEGTKEAHIPSINGLFLPAGSKIGYNAPLHRLKEGPSSAFSSPVPVSSTVMARNNGVGTWEGSPLCMLRRGLVPRGQALPGRGLGRIACPVRKVADMNQDSGFEGLRGIR